MMNRSCLALAMVACVAACGSLPSAPGGQAVHDLGGSFAALNAPVPLRSVSVSAQPLVAGTAMQYREAAMPTRRAAYAVNRWAASPAAMLEGALTRLLGVESGTCRLQVSLAEFIVDIDANGRSRALIAADVRLVTDTLSRQRAIDVSAPLAQTSPASAALAMREATQKLGGEIAAWLRGEAGAGCKKS